MQEVDYYGEEEVKLCPECDRTVRKLAKRLLRGEDDPEVAVFLAVPPKDGFPILADTMYVDSETALFGAFVYAKSA